MRGARGHGFGPHTARAVLHAHPRKRWLFFARSMSVLKDGRASKRKFEHIKTEEDVLKEAAGILQKRVSRSGSAGGRGYDALNKHLLVDAATFYPLDEWKKVFKQAAARTDVDPALNTACHAVVLDSADVADAALAVAVAGGLEDKPVSYDDNVNMLTKLASQIGTQARANHQKRKHPDGAPGAAATPHQRKAVRRALHGCAVACVAAWRGRMHPT